MREKKELIAELKGRGWVVGEGGREGGGGGGCVFGLRKSERYPPV